MSAKQAARVKRPAIDFTSALDQAQARSAARADDRFDRAASVLKVMPNALTTSESSVRAAAGKGGFDVLQLQVGQEYDVPIGLIDPNRIGARHYYLAESVDEVGLSLQEDGQMVAVNGFVKEAEGRVELIEGGTRLRAAKSCGRDTLRVKIEPAPKDLREQYKRSVQFHDLRSDHSALDTAVAFQRLLDEGAYATQEELGADIKDKRGNSLTRGQVNQYLRLTKIPDRLRRMMVEHEQTRAFTIAYEISAVFTQENAEDRREEYERLGEDIIREVQQKGLSRAQVQALIASKLKGPRSRQRGEAIPVKFAGKAGTIKTFATRGQLDFSIRGLSPELLEQLRQAIETVCAAQLRADS